jgi:hypothetical protein
MSPPATAAAELVASAVARAVSAARVGCHFRTPNRTSSPALSADRWPCGYIAWTRRLPGAGKRAREMGGPVSAYPFRSVAPARETVNLVPKAVDGETEWSS